MEVNEYRVLGLDPARFGDDWTIGCEIIANVAKFVIRVQKQDTMATAGKLVHIHEDYNKIGIETTGVGGGVYDRAVEMGSDPLLDEKFAHKFIAIEPGSKPTQFKRFANLRSEMYWSLRERLRPDGAKWMKIQLPNDDELKNQLASIKYKFTSDGRIILESKDDMKKRGLKSPDKADALAIAAWIAVPHKPKDITSNPIYKEFFAEKAKQRGSSDVLDGIID